MSYPKNGFYLVSLNNKVLLTVKTLCWKNKLIFTKNLIKPLNQQKKIFNDVLEGVKLFFLPLTDKLINKFALNTEKLRNNNVAPC